MTYHPSGRWMDNGTLRSAARGQEFVARPSNMTAAAEWVASLLEKTT
jgi:hypothetical protein